MQLSIDTRAPTSIQMILVHVQVRCRFDFQLTQYTRTFPWREVPAQPAARVDTTEGTRHLFDVSAKFNDSKYVECMETHEVMTMTCTHGMHSIMRA